MAKFKTKQQQNIEDLDITRDELNQIGEALKQEEFRKLFNDYIEEVQNPENQKLFESEIAQLERERGNDVTFIHPKPGYVIKTSLDGEKKAFINVCCNDNIGKPTAIPEDGGLHWSIPYSQAPPRDDFDKKNNLCLVFDVVFHPDTIQMAQENRKFKEMVSDTAMNAVEKEYKVILDKQNRRYPKVEFKGCKRPTVIRRKSKKPLLHSQDSDQEVFEIPNYPYPSINEEHNVVLKPCPVPTKSETTYSSPKYIIKQRRNVDIQECTNSMTSKINAAIPNELVVEIELPLLKSASDVTLDVTEKSLKLVSEKPAKYKLDITLPYCVNEDEGNAKFDCSTKKLNVTLVVKRIKQVQNIFEITREDSGVDSDLGSCSRSNESSSEDETSKIRVNSLEDGVEDKLNSDNNDYRTSKLDTSFLCSDKHYALPQFQYNVLKNVIAFTFQVKNVEPSSVKSRYLDKDSGFHLKFTSIGAGFFPIYYSFCVKFQSGVSVNTENLNLEVWDNNVIAQVSIVTCDNLNISEFYCGVSESSLEKHLFTNSFKVLQALKNEIDISNPSDNVKVEVLKFEEDNVLFEIKSTNKEADEDENNKCTIETDNKLINDEKEENVKLGLDNENDGSDVVKDLIEEKVEVENPENVGNINKNTITKHEKKVLFDTGRKETGCPKIDNEIVEVKEIEMVKTTQEKLDKSDQLENVNETNKQKKKNPYLRKASSRSNNRTMSESHSEKLESKPCRGILKVGRSLSESSADDYQWTNSSTVDCTDPESIEKNLKPKKTVTFSDWISKKTYRLNSSILGQRKKNQRKSRNKKRAQERRMSESENSEAEESRERVEKAEDDTSESQSDISQSDISQSDVSESDDGIKPDYKPDVMSLSKRNPHKRGGKKSARKSANTAKMAFTNNLMFDLDM